MEGRLTFLGTGTSMGVPTLGCDCAVCTSADPRDRRLRPSVLAAVERAPREDGARRSASVDHRHRSGFPRAGPAHAAHPCRRRALYPLARRPHHGPRRSAAAELRVVSRRRARFPLYAAARDRGGAGAHLRLPLLAPSPPIPRARACTLQPLADRIRIHEVEFTLRAGETRRDGHRRLSLRRHGLPDRRERNSRVELRSA